MVSLNTLLETLPQTGRVTWIGVRPARRAAVQPLEQVQALTDRHLEGDHYGASPGSKRQVTLIQQEHVAALGALVGTTPPDPALLRRNIAIAGLNLLALKDKRFRVGEALLEFTDLCVPCARMEEALGPGGYNAMRGHGGITARILEGGLIRLGDSLRYEP